jgi:hypothetical protein
MGGTEIEPALKMAIRLRCPEKIHQDVMLITDGEIWNWEGVVARAAKWKHRFFTVGVGSATSEAFLRKLSECTGGACEFVSPNENMAERIHHHFKRIGTPCSRHNEIAWPSEPIKIFPEVLGNIYNGDTFNVFAWFSEPPIGNVKLKVLLPNGLNQIMTINIEPHAEENDQNNDVARMAAEMMLQDVTEEQKGQELAVKYQLASRWTNYLAIVARDNEKKASVLPELYTVDQMLTAGWGGFGSVRDSIRRNGNVFQARFSCICDRSADDDCSSAENITVSRERIRMIEAKVLRDLHKPEKYGPKLTRVGCSSVDDRTEVIRSSAPSEDYYDNYESYEDEIPYDISFHLSREDNWLWDTADMTEFVEALAASAENGEIYSMIDMDFLPNSLKCTLKNLIAEGLDEEKVVISFIYLFSQYSTGEKLLPLKVIRIIVKQFIDMNIEDKVFETVAFRLYLDL